MGLLALVLLHRELLTRASEQHVFLRLRAVGLWTASQGAPGTGLCAARCFLGLLPLDSLMGNSYHVTQRSTFRLRLFGPWSPL